MTLFSLNSLIDDIMLIVRNNNISESEDLSRSQLEEWINHYRAMLIKQSVDKGYDPDPCCFQEIGPIELEKIPINNIDNPNSLEPDTCPWYKYKTKQVLPKPVCFHFGNGFISVTDLHDATIQEISKTRRYFQWYRKYTNHEYSYYYMPDYIYVQGPDLLRYIKVTGIFEDPTEAGYNPDDQYPIPADMISTIKQLIFNNELKFMINRPSDDKNDASLANIKPVDNA